MFAVGTILISQDYGVLVKITKNKGSDIEGFVAEVVSGRRQYKNGTIFYSCTLESYKLFPVKAKKGEHRKEIIELQKKIDGVMRFINKNIVGMPNKEYLRLMRKKNKFLNKIDSYN